MRANPNHFLLKFSILLILILHPTWKLVEKQPTISETGITTLASIASDGTQGNGESRYPFISAGGRYVTFRSVASTLVSGDTNGEGDIFVHDTQTGQTTRVSIASDGTEANGDSTYPSISADGRYIAFASTASNLAIEDTSGWWNDVFLHDLQTGQTTLISIASDGTGANGYSVLPSLSADGRYVAFESWATNLVDEDTNEQKDVFVHDTQTRQTIRVSVASDGTEGNGECLGLFLSADGKYVAFSSVANNLAGVDTNGGWDIFIHEIETGQTTRVSVASNGTEANGWSWSPSLSDDGKYVAFYSTASNLVSRDTNGEGDIFVHNTQTGQTTRVSIASDGTEADHYSGNPEISSNGRYVTFESVASNLVNGDTNGWHDVFVHDTQTGQTTRVSITSEGIQGDDFSWYPSLSGDGRYVVFHSGASNLVNGDMNGVPDIFIHDRWGGPWAFLPIVTRP